MKIDRHATRTRRPRLVALVALPVTLAIVIAIMFGLNTANAGVSATADTGSGGVQINSGGGDLSPLVADTDFTGGATADCRCSVSPHSANAIQQYAYTTNRYGDFHYTVPGLTPGAAYAVRLYFAETYWTQVGQRIFNVSINGATVLSDFDIVAQAGSWGAGIERDFTAVADGTGQVVVTFTSVKDNAQVNALVVLPASAPSASPSPSISASGGVQINSGGGDLSPLVADTDFTGGATADCRCSVSPHSANAIQQYAYTTNRYGDFHYTVPGLTPGAAYAVRLYFAETYWTQVGQRIFNVSINGATVLSDFDIVAQAGSWGAGIERDFTAVADGAGQVVVMFTTVKDNAQVNAIVVIS